jgi:ABC-2 type transport system ATP-binding protein
MRRKTSLAAALIHDPAVLFLDEPLAGIDAVSSRVIKDILESLTKRGVTVFFCSHVLEVAEKLCHRVAILNRGVLLAVGEPDRLKEDMGLSASVSLEDLFLEMVGRPEAAHSLSWIK